MKKTMATLATFGRWIAGLEIVTRKGIADYDAKIVRVIEQQRAEIEATWELHLETGHANPNVTNTIGYAQITMLNGLVAKLAAEYPKVNMPAPTAPSELKKAITERVNAKRPGPVEIPAKKVDEGAA